MEPFFIARQPVFNTDESIWGYELLFRAALEHDTARITNGQSATSQVIIDGYSAIKSTVSDEHKILINYPRTMILTGAPLLLPKEHCIVEILETVKPEKKILSALEHIKSRGYTLALDDFVGEPGFEPFLEIADIVKVDVLGMSQEKIEQVYGELGKYDFKILAEKVEDQGVFDFTKSLGFDLFQGFFFARPVIIPGRKLTTNQATKIHLLKELFSSEYEVSKISTIITTDVSLSYRLLKYINSASFGFRHKVKSINQAITLLGRDQLSRWLKVIIMSDLNTSPKGKELAYMSVLRGRFLELLSQKGKHGPYPSETMFMLGLFSLLDAMLGIPMNSLLEDLPLDQELKEALAGETNDATPWVSLLSAYDLANWSEVSNYIKDLNFPPGLLTTTRTEAMTWAKQLFVAT